MFFRALRYTFEVVTIGRFEETGDLSGGRFEEAGDLRRRVGDCCVVFLLGVVLAFWEMIR